MQAAIRPVASNVRRLRERRGLSLSALARAAGVSKATLFKIERGEGNPAIETLWSIAQALGVPFAVLFTEDEPATIDVLRFEDAPLIARKGTSPLLPDGNHGYAMRHLLSRHQRGELEAYCVDLAEGALRDAAPHPAGVIEHAVVAEGTLEITVDDESVLLERGDRMSFPADRPHRYRPIDGAARAIVLLDYP